MPGHLTVFRPSGDDDMLDMQALEQALSGIEDLGRAELEFEAGPVKVTLRILSPDEEIAVQRYARQATNHLSDDAHDDEREAAMMEFLDRFKQGVLSYAICQIGQVDLRSESTVATGEMLTGPDGPVPVRIPCHEAVRKLIRRWARPILLACFSKYGDLVERIELSTESAIKWNPTDLAAEIGRMENRLVELKEAQAQQAPPGTDNKVAQQVRTMTESDRNERDASRRQPLTPSPVDGSDLSVPDGGHDDEPPVVVTSAPSRASRQAPTSDRVAAHSTVPTPEPEPQALPPAAPHVRQSAIPSAGAPAPGRQEQAPEPEPPAPGALDIVMDSMSDPNDHDAIAAENARLMAARAQQDESAGAQAAAIRAEALAASKKARQEAEIGGGIRPARRKKTPPHRAAANTADAVLDTGVNTIQPTRSTARPPTDGVDTYEMPSTTLSGRTKQKRGGEVPVNETAGGAGGSSNPRFKPRR